MRINHLILASLFLVLIAIGCLDPYVRR